MLFVIRMVLQMHRQFIPRLTSISSASVIFFFFYNFYSFLSVYLAVVFGDVAVAVLIQLLCARQTKLLLSS